MLLHVDALHLLGIADPDRAMSGRGQALAALDGTTDARTLRWRVSLHNNAGWARFDAGDYPGAIAEFELAKDAATRMSFLLTNSSAASRPISLEVPERLTPPKGSSGESASTTLT